MDVKFCTMAALLKFLNGLLVPDLLKDPPFMGNLVYKDFLKLHYIKRKFTHESPLAVGSFTA